MKFKEIKIKDLDEFIKSEWFLTSSDLPITTHRAISQIKNPRALSNDICLILALNDKNELLGYIGILSDNFHEKATHFGWLSCWWVHPQKGNRVGFSLFLQALIAWNNQFVITDFTPQIKNIIERTRMFEFTPTQYGIRGFLGFNFFEILPRKFPLLAKTKSILKFIDFSFNGILKLRNLYLKKVYQTENINISIEENIDSEIAKFISKHQQKEYFGRNADDLNWILNNNWVLENNKLAQNEAKKYYFSSSDSVFKYHLLALRKSKKLFAFAILRQRKLSFTLPYIYSETGFESEVMQCIYHYLLKFNATDFTIFNKQFVKISEKQKHPFLYTRKIPKDFALTNEMAQNIDTEKYLQDGDGDYVFT